MKKLVAVALIGVGLTAAREQAFEVATIKPVSDGSTFLGLKSPGIFGADSIPLTGLLMQAYGVRSFQIQGGPNWVHTERFEVRGKYDPSEVANESPEHLWLRIDVMLKNLLEERFALRTHSEERQLPTYSLAISRKGSKLAPSECIPRDGGFSDRPSAKEDCGYSRYGMHGRNRTLEWTGVSMHDFVQFALQNIVNQPVLDRTGLTGVFDFHLEWTPDQATAGISGGGRLSSDSAVVEGDGFIPTSIFTAIEEQLGLKLEATRGPVEVIVIDSVTKPDPN
jgi:uncharacterized protein (TIGR03435 family)